MKKIRRKLIAYLSVFALLCGVILLSGIGKKGVGAAEATSYLAKATAYYKHPITGKVEDAGNNEGIGQSMTESVLNNKALLEKTTSGKWYATVRIFLTDNIKNVKIWTQKRGGSSWTKVSTKIMQKNLNGKYCTDYRFALSEKNNIMRMSFYVTPMGRDIIFYFDFSNLKKGSGDFITLAKNEKNSTSNKSSSSDSKSSTSSSSVANKSSSSESNQLSGSASSKSSDSDSSSSKSSDSISSKSSDSASNKSTVNDKDATEGSDENNTIALGAQSSAGETLIANADGLTVSDDSLLEETTSGQTDTVDGTKETTQTSDSDTEKDQEEELTQVEANAPLTLSWVFVLQCILIITVPSMILLGAYALLSKKRIL